MILRPPGFFFPVLRDKVGFPGFPPRPGFFPLGLRERVGFFGAPVLGGAGGGELSSIDEASGADGG